MRDDLVMYVARAIETADQACNSDYRRLARAAIAAYEEGRLYYRSITEAKENPLK